MSRSLNKVMLIGHVGNEPEIRTTANGKKVARLSLATSRTFNDRNGQKQEKTEWHRLTAWDRTAEIIERYVNKGDRLYVEGSIEYSQTEDENGKPRFWTDIVIREMVMLSGVPADSRHNDGEDAPVRRGPPPSPFNDDDDDLPF